MILTDSMSKIFYETVNRERVIWDYFQCFSPPEDIAVGKKTFFKVEDLDPKSIEYQYVAYKFGKTRNGRDDKTLCIKETIKRLISEGLPAEANNVQKI